MNILRKYLCGLLVIGLLVSGSIIPSQAASIVCGISIGPCAETPVQGTNLFNSQTTGAATTAVTVTIAAIVFSRVHVYAVEGRCNTAANTSGITITDGGTTIWSTVATEVLAANNFVRNWSPGLTAATNSAVVITLAACAAGTGTLIVQADQW